jgi:hypothetical protein
MCKPTELSAPTTNSTNDLPTKETQALCEPLRRFEILDLPQPVTKAVVPAMVPTEKPQTSDNATERQMMIFLLIAILVVAAFGVGTIVAIHAMRA